MKPGTSIWLRVVATFTVAAVVCLSPLSTARADKLPVKQTEKPILAGEPEDPDGTIPTGAITVSSSTLKITAKPDVKGEPENPDGALLVNLLRIVARWVLHMSTMLRV